MIKQILEGQTCRNHRSPTEKLMLTPFRKKRSSTVQTHKELSFRNTVNDNEKSSFLTFEDIYKKNPLDKVTLELVSLVCSLDNEIII